ncbi:hypothetical protein SLA2020_465880 [Shorea laevis]
MDHKTWLWRKKSSEKLILTPDKANHSQKGNEEETLVDNKGELENEMKILKDKLSSALSECSEKDELVKKHSTMMQEAVAGWEKAKVEIASLRQDLDTALQHRVVTEERSTQSDAALKECMQQLRFVREEQEQRIHDAVMKASNEYEKSQMLLEEKLAETSKRLAKVGAESSNISKALLAKEKQIEDINKQRAQMEADFNALMTRLDSKEKENASLKYEVRVLEKEVEIRNEEREFNRRTAEASHKQHLESVKKIAKLESECQRLRLLVRKRLPGPGALAKMKNEVQMLGRDSAEIRRRKSNSTAGEVMNDYAVDDFQEAPGKRINILMEQLCAMEEENKALKEALIKKTNELQFSRVVNAQTASRLSDVESRLEEPSKCLTNMEPTRKSVIQHQLSLVSMSDISSDDKASCAESWASALISELEHFRNGRLTGLPSCKSVGSSEINLMDDFVEMEKLALVSVDKPSGNLLVSSEEGNIPIGPSHNGAGRNYSEVMPRKVVSVPDSQADFSVLNRKLDSKNPSISRVPDWLQDILKIILEQNRATKRNPDDILEDIKKALVCIIHPKTGEFLYEKEKPSNVSSWMDSFGGNTDIDISLAKKSSQQFQSDLSKSLCRIIELIEGINLPLPDYSIPETLSKEENHLSDKHSETPSGYMVRVFQWKTSELCTVLRQFVHACYDLLNGRSDLKKFAQELTSALDWIMNHCFSLQDVSSMRDEIKKHLDWDESRSESETEVGVVGHFAVADKLQLPAPYCQKALFQNKQPNVREDIKNLSNELINIEAENKNLGEKLHSTVNPRYSHINQLDESEKTIADLQTELETLKKAKGMVEGQLEKPILIIEDFNTQPALTKVELNEACQKFPSAKFESENKSICSVEPAATLLESVTKEIPNSEVKKEERHLRADWEISAASEKLAECQETILNLGKQLKALSSPNEAALFDKVISSPSNAITTASATPSQPENKMTSQRSSLLDQMLAEDTAEVKSLKSPKTKQNNGNSDSPSITNGPLESLENVLVLNESKHEKDDGTIKSLAIVPSKKQGRSLWRRLLWRKKKGNSKKAPLQVAPPQLIT